MLTMTLSEALNHACEHLPEGWEIRIHAEKGAAWADLKGPMARTFKPSRPYDELSEQIQELVEFAQCFTSSL